MRVGCAFAGSAREPAGDLRRGVLVRRVVEVSALFVLLALVGIRPLVGESYDSAGSVITRALQAVADPSPLRTLVFDLLILGSACAWLATRTTAFAHQYRRTGLEWGLCILALATVASCLGAGNKRLAINASIDWLCYPILTIVLVQLLRESWSRRLLLAVVLASACAQAVQCFDQHLTFDDTWAQYLASKEDGLWESQGVDTDSPTVELFERRMKSHDVQGFLPHSGIAGSYLVLCAFAALTIVVDRLRRPIRAGPLGVVLPVAGAILIVAACCLTRSRGALLAGVVGLLLWATLSVCGRWVRSNRPKALLLGWGLMLGACMAVVGHGLFHGSLPSSSLNFRWMYWRASSKLVADHALTGVGRENFGRHYTQYKSIESPEEIANPHNLFVQAAADWGVPGLAGMIVLLAGASAGVTGVRIRARPLPPADGQARSPSPTTGRDGAPGEMGRLSVPSTDPLTCTPSASPYRRTVVWGLALAIAVIVGRVPLVGSADSAFIAYSTILIGSAWVVGFAVSAPRSMADQPAGTESHVCVLLGVGLLAFLLHDMVNFALFTPATATTFFALLACVIAERAPSGVVATRRKTSLAWRAPVVAMLVVITVAVTHVMPVARSQALLRSARLQSSHLTSASINDQPAGVLFLQAANADPLDPTPCAERASWLLRLFSIPRLYREATDFVLQSLDEAIRRDPFNISHHRLKTLVLRNLAMTTGQHEDYFASVDSARHTLELYPEDPRTIILLADCRLVAGEALRDRELLASAMSGFDEAVTLDLQRHNWKDEVRRFRPNELTEIRAKINRAQDALDQPTE